MRGTCLFPASPLQGQYNEVIVDAWNDGAIDAFFLVDCEPGESNRVQPGGWKRNAIGGLIITSTCAQAHAWGREIHAAFVQSYPDNPAPLVMLRRSHWDFVYAAYPRP